MSLVVFTDRNIGKAFPAELRKAGILVERHEDHFAPDTADQVWLADVGKRGWLVVSRDRRIRYRSNERDAVIGAGVGLVILIGSATTEDLARTFVHTLPKIQAFVARESRPYIAKLYRPSPAELHRNASAPGRIERWYP